MARIAIIGLGAIGSSVAAALQQTGQHELLFCTRRPLGPVRVDTPSGPVELSGTNLTESLQGSAVDWAIVVTKAYDAAAASLWFPTLLGDHTRVAVLQNGVEHREHFPSIVNEKLVPVIVQHAAERRPDGTILQRVPISLDADGTRSGHDFAVLFSDGVRTHADFLSVAWRKLCLNAAGAVSALTLQPNGVMRAEAPGRLAREIAEECATVARAEGATLPEEIGQQVVDFYRNAAPEGVNSLLADRLANRRMESDARNGVIVRRGERHGIPTPLNRMACTLLQAAAKSS